ncbi:MAG TPA: SOS response-associated peptidase [Stellaceae bacterium]|nr:SOS response-associated peptidase [Stellaceae bacterium]
MCGRFLNRTPASETAKLFGTSNPVPNYPARYNLAPTEGVLAVRFSPDDVRRHLEVMRWGLIPLWAKDRSIGNKLVNARSETVAETPAFRDAFARHRCIVPADGFYEWKKTTSGKEPFAIVPAEGEPVFAFAGLWARWRDPATQEFVKSCTILTCPPNELVAPIHDRMPVILDRADWAKWLGEDSAKRPELNKMLKPFPAGRMRAFRIGQRVNNVRNDDAALLVPE